MTTGELIKDARRKANLTQKELGEKLGISFQSIAQWENGIRNPKYESLQRIAFALNIPVDSLMGAHCQRSADQMTVMVLGQRIAEARKQVNLTQEQLAAKCGLATITVRQYESGKRQPRLEQLETIASALGWTLSQFVATPQATRKKVNEMNATTERQKQREQDKQERIQRYSRISGAAKRMIEASAELHLTWEEFDDAIELSKSIVRANSYVCGYPYPSVPSDPGNEG